MADREKSCKKFKSCEQRLDGYCNVDCPDYEWDYSTKPTTLTKEKREEIKKMIQQKEQIIIREKQKPFRRYPQEIKDYTQGTGNKRHKFRKRRH